MNDNLNKIKYSDEDLNCYYDIVFDINSLENLKQNGWKIEATEKGYQKYLKKKDKRCTLVSLLGKKNKGKTFILSKINNLEIPDGCNITTKGLSFIISDKDENNIIFLDTAGFEIPLCEDDEFFKFYTNNEKYLNLSEKEKKLVSIKDYMNEDEYFTQIQKFTRDKQITNEFIKKFVLYSSNVNIYIVNSELDLEDQNFYKNFLEDKFNIIIHNLKTFRKKIEVEDYIESNLLKSVSFKLFKNFFTINKKQKKNDNYNNIYYKQIFEEGNKYENMKIFHLFMANENSEAGSYYNESTINFIRKIIETNLNFVKFPILENVREFLFDHSEEFFNEPLENKEDLKIIEEDCQKLKYTNKEKPFELKECYIDELGNANFIQSNYKPSYRAYKAIYRDDNGESNKLILDIEISGEVDIKDIEKPKIVNKNGQNIITITGKRNLTKGNLNKTTATIKSIADYKPSYFDNNNKMFNLIIYIPNEKCIIGNLYKRIFNVDKGLYRFIYNIQEKNDVWVKKEHDVFVDDDDEDDDYEDDEV